MNRIARAFNGLPLVAQVGLSGIAATVLLAAAWHRWGEVVWTVALSSAGLGLAATILAMLVVARACRGLSGVGSAARLLSRDGASEDQQIPFVETSPEFVEVTMSLRRMVEAARERERALEARIVGLTHRLEHRTVQLNTLQDLSIGLAGTADIHELVSEALGALEQTLEYTSASLWARNASPTRDQVVLLGYRTSEDAAAREKDDLTGLPLSRSNLHRYEQIEREGQPVIDNNVKQSLLSWLWTLVTDDARSSALYQASRSWMAIPLKFRDHVLGVMRVDHQEPDYFDAERARLLTAVSSQTALAMRHSQLLTLEREVAVITERTRIARDLHDAVSQTLFAASLIAGTLAKSAGRGAAMPAETVAAHARSLEKLNRGALAEMRLMMFELRPDALEQTPLSDLLSHAIEALACRGEVTVEQKVAKRDRLAPEVRLQIYRIAQEALSNVTRHSGAKHLSIEWRPQGTHGGWLRVADDGKGFDPEQAAPGHFGLENMRHRAAQIGARLVFNSSAGQGAELILELDGTTDAAR